MKRFVYASLAVAVALVVAGVVGGAGAQTGSEPQPSTVSVGGSATHPLAQGSNLATANAAYRDALAAAVDSAHTKASFLAGKVGKQLGSAQNVVEDGGYVSCDNDNVDYTGAYPDTAGSSLSGGSAASGNSGAATQSGSGTHHKKKKRKHRGGPLRSAGNAPCDVSAEVSITYSLAG